MGSNPTSVELRFMVSSSSIEFSETVATSDSVLSLKEKLLTTHAEKVTGASRSVMFFAFFLPNRVVKLA